MNDDKKKPSPSSITAFQWRQIVDSAVDTAIISLDLQGRVTAWNTEASQILGWDEREMLGQTLDRIFPQGHNNFRSKWQMLAVRVGEAAKKAGVRAKTARGFGPPAKSVPYENTGNWSAMSRFCVTELASQPMKRPFAKSAGRLRY